MSNIFPVSGISGLSFWFYFTISLLFLYLVLLLFLSFFCLLAHSPEYFKEILQYFSFTDRLFCMAPDWQLGEVSWSVVRAACCLMTLVFAVMHFCSFLFLYTFFNLVLINRRNGPQYRRVLALCAFFNRGNTEGTNSSIMLCLMFVYVMFCLCKFVSWLILWVLENLWFDDLRAL